MLVSMEQDATHALRLMHNERGVSTNAATSGALKTCLETAHGQRESDDAESEPVWFPLQTVFWRSTAADVKNGLPADVLSLPWQLSLFGDGSTLYHLELLTKQNIHVQIISLSEQNDVQPDFEPLADVLPRPWIRRQIFLETEDTREKVIYAASWWNGEYSKKLMKDETKPVWSNLYGLDVFRDFRGIIYGNSPALERMFGVAGPFWARYYLLWHRGHPLCLIYEVYSNALSTYLGSSLATPEKLMALSHPQQ